MHNICHMFEIEFPLVGLSHQLIGPHQIPNLLRAYLQFPESPYNNAIITGLNSNVVSNTSRYQTHSITLVFPKTDKLLFFKISSELKF